MNQLLRWRGHRIKIYLFYKTSICLQLPIKCPHVPLPPPIAQTNKQTPETLDIACGRSCRTEFTVLRVIKSLLRMSDTVALCGIVMFFFQNLVECKVNSIQKQKSTSYLISSYFQIINAVKWNGFSQTFMFDHFIQYPRQTLKQRKTLIKRNV